jgi:protein ImuB
MSENSSIIPPSRLPHPEPGHVPSSTPPRRYLALWFPFLSTDRARLRATKPLRAGAPDDPPFVLVEKDRGALRIAALDLAAARSHLAIGMPLSEARALLPNIVAAAADRHADAGCLLAAASACEMFTPLVGMRGGDGLLLDITGCAHLFGGEGPLGAQACRRFIRMGLSTRAAIARTPEAAWAFARFTGGGAVPSGDEESVARGLPVTALESDEPTTIALSRAGFRTLGDLADRPSNLLTARFGADLVSSLHRILGREDIRITPLRPPPDVMAERHFPEPLLAMESLLTVFEKLAQDIALLLERRSAGGRAFEVSFFRSDGAVRRLTIETAQGTRDAASLMRLIRLRIDALADPLDPGFGFDAIRLGVARIEVLKERQQHLAGEREPDNEETALAELVDRMVARFGRESIRRFVAQDTHDPARAGGTAPYLCEAVGAPWSAPEAESPPARPLTLFAQPQPIEVLAEVPDSPPLRFRWRRVLHEVARAEGPERIAPEWWQGAVAGGDRPPATRDYYRVENAAGHRFWVFREGFYEDANTRPRWFVHGLFA